MKREGQSETGVSVGQSGSSDEEEHNAHSGIRSFRRGSSSESFFHYQMAASSFDINIEELLPTVSAPDVLNAEKEVLPMSNRHKGQLGNVLLSSRLVTVLGLILIFSLMGSSATVAKDGSAFVRQVRVIETDVLGLTPLAWFSHRRPTPSTWRRRANQPSLQLHSLTS
jgi:hypothetical protein